MDRNPRAPKGQQHWIPSRRRHAVVSIALAVTFAGCNMGVDEFCLDALPQFERQLAQASSELPQRKIVIRSRTPASEADAGQPVGGPSNQKFTDEDRLRWREWSQERLGEIQDSLDIAADNPEMAPVRRELSSAADQTVALYGFATAGNTEKMRESLGTLDRMVAEVKRKVCPRSSRP